MTIRSLPVLELPPRPGWGSAPPRAPASPAPAVDEFVLGPEVLPRFFIWTLGCQMNRSDAEEMAGALLAAGCAEAPTLETADLIVINSCAIREAAEQKVIGRMGQLAALKRGRPGTRVVLTGCSVRENARRHLRRRYPEVDLFLRPDEEPELVPRLGLASATAPAALGGQGEGQLARLGGSVVGTAHRLPAARLAAVRTGTIRRQQPWEAWVPVIYGCDKTCTYCIVPFSRGPERSRSFDDILEECRLLGEAGILSVTLLGQNVNSYGHDLSPDQRFAGLRGERALGPRLELAGRPDFATLLRAVDSLCTVDGRPAIPRLRFLTSHPWDLTDRLVAAIAECPAVCEHLHLPVQSGDDAVLRRMGRQYTVQAYLGLVERLRAAVPGITLSTDVIVGFCGETELQFEATLDLLRLVCFDQVFAAAYSPRPGTPAMRLADDISPAEKRRRLNALLALQEGIGWERNRASVGLETEVLIDRVERPRAHAHEPDPAGGTAGRSLDGRNGGAGTMRLAGRNRQNKLIHLDGPADWLGGFVNVRVERAGPYALNGSAVDPVVSRGVRP